MPKILFLEKWNLFINAVERDLGETVQVVRGRSLVDAAAAVDSHGRFDLVIMGEINGPYQAIIAGINAIQAAGMPVLGMGLEATVRAAQNCQFYGNREKAVRAICRALDQISDNDAQAT